MFAFREAYQAKLFTRSNLVKNIFAGLVVGIVALPLSMAFAIASGARPENGLYTAIIAAIFVAIFGGSRVQISGPTGAFIVILAGITGRYGFAGLQLATIVAGCILLLMGVMRLGTVIKFIPQPVIAGFTAGIGVIIFVGQWKDFFGLPISLKIDAHFHDKLISLISVFPKLDLTTMLLALLSLALVIFSGKVTKKIPGPLVAMLVVTVIQSVFHFGNVATIGTVFGEIPQGFPKFTMPVFTFQELLDILGPAFTIALLGAIESLLSATAADGMADTRHSPNNELIGQGLANFVAPFFGGFASTGAIARTATNVKNGGNSPVAAIVHSIFLLTIILFLAPLAKYIPLCSLAAILFVVAYNMSDIPHFSYILRHSTVDDKLVLLITFGLTVFTDLVTAVNVGVVLAMLFFMLHIIRTSRILEETVNLLEDEKSDPHLYGFKRKVLIYSIHGPLFFAVTEKFADSIVSSTNTHDETNAVVFNLSIVPFIDFSGLLSFQETIEKLRKRNILVYLYGANAAICKKFSDMALLELIEGKRSFSSLEKIASYDNKLYKNLSASSV